LTHVTDEVLMKCVTLQNAIEVVYGVRMTAGHYIVFTVCTR